MPKKITDARIEELKALKSRRDGLVERIQVEREGMEALLKLMDTETRESTQSSSRAAKEKRGKEKDRSKFSHEEAIDIHQMAIERLQENYSQVTKELEGLEKLVYGESAVEEPI